MGDRDLHVPNKWGFGMAPPKPEHEQRYRAAAKAVHDIVKTGIVSERESGLAALSEVKGLFNRCVRQDQWDWFIVWSRFAYPAQRTMNNFVEGLAQTRAAWHDGQENASPQALMALRREGLPTYLATFLGELVEVQQSDVGFLYVLETREFPGWLKIGRTDRTVEERTGEINRATGVLVPWGARAAWRVIDSESAEGEVHRLLDSYRIRGDREFFQIEFRKACGLITDALRARLIPPSFRSA